MCFLTCKRQDSSGSTLMMWYLVSCAKPNCEPQLHVALLHRLGHNTLICGR